MTDRELLELAAKAAGHKIYWYVNDIHRHGRLLLVDEGVKRHDWKSWNPLTDDGAALRLAVKLGLFMRKVIKEIPRVEYDKDPYGATRRTIVRAAAEIGKLK